MAPPKLIDQPAPAFQLVNDQNKPRTLDDVVGENGVLLVFVYGSYCATCVQTLISLARAADGFAERGVNIVVISLDEWSHSRTFKLGLGVPIPFDILADTDSAVHEAYGSTRQSFGGVFVRPDGTVGDVIRADRYPGTRTLVRLATGAATA